MNEGQLTPLRRFKGESHPDFSVFIALIIMHTVEAPFHLETPAFQNMLPQISNVSEVR